MEFDKKCKEIQVKIGKLIIAEEGLTLRDICGILDMTKHYFLMEIYKKLK